MQRPGRRVKVIRWAMFGVLLSLLPIVGAYIGGAALGKAPGLFAFLSRGDLLLVATTLAAAAAGELLGSPVRREDGRDVFVGGVAIAVSILGAFSFALLTTATSLGERPAQGFVSAFSTVLFVLSVASGASCVALSEE